MNFGLQFTNTFPQEGGGYTFETEIIKAWAEAATEHEVWFCSYHKALPNSMKFLGTRHISLQPGPAERWRLKSEKFRRSVLRSAGFAAPPVFPSVTSMIAAAR